MYSTHSFLQKIIKLYCYYFSYNRNILRCNLLLFCTYKHCVMKSHTEKNPLLPDPCEEAVEVQQQYVKGLLNRLTQKPKSVRGACKKCGFSGHLTFQCMNFISVAPVASKDEPVSIASIVSSEESGEYNSEKEDRKRKRKSSKERSGKRAKRDSSAEVRHKERKKLKKERKKLKEKERKHKSQKVK